MKNSKGITLISLAISIIVLSIFISVAMAAIDSKEGEIIKAKEAKEKTRCASIERVIDVWILESKLNDLDIETIIEELKKQELITEDEANKIRNENKIVVANKEIKFKPTNEEIIIPEGKHNNIEPGVLAEKKEEYIEVNPVTGKKERAIIPKGFCVVKTVSKKHNSIYDGLVISDAANDDLDNTAGGNQFVWIPIDPFKFEEEFRRKGNLNQFIENDETGKNSILKETQETKKETMELYGSVREYGGFYFGRFETGWNKKLQKAVVRKGANIKSFTYVRFGSDEIQVGNNIENKDAYALWNARGLYPNNAKSLNEHSVVSTLCYGVQWDTALDFISEIDKEYRNDSSGKGNYNQVWVANAGADESYKLRNIYDMAGNVWEWTMEITEDSFGKKRVCRGGSFKGYGSSTPAGARLGVLPAKYGTEGVLTGFRICLYIK